MASTSNYWSHREHQAKRWIKNNLADDDAMQREILARYKEASKNIQAEINREYMAYAKATGYNMADAMDDVKGEDVQAFAETAARMVQDRDFSDRANTRLKLYNATMRINKLEYLKSMIGVEMTKATSKTENDIYAKVQQGYADEYQRQAGILTEYANDFDPSRVINTVLKSYSPRDFSTSVWQSQDLLKTKLDQALTQGLIRGLNPRRIAKELMPVVNTAMQSAAYAAERIARTEMAHAQNMAQLDSFHNNGVDKVVWIAEPSACDECAAHDDKVYKLDEQPELPAHPNCRCALAADPDWAGLDKEIDEYLAAKDTSLSSISDVADHVNSRSVTADHHELNPDSLNQYIKRGAKMSAEEADQHNANPNYLGMHDKKVLTAKMETLSAEANKYYAAADEAYNKYIETNDESLLKRRAEYLTKADALDEPYNKLLEEFDAAEKNAEGYRVNCQRCAPAYELRRRGYDVTALPNNGGSHHDVFEVPANMWRNADGSISKPKFVEATTNGAVTKKLIKQMQIGERGTIQWSWKGANSAHIIDVERTADGLLVVDSQIGQIATSFEEYMGNNRFKTQITQKGVHYKTGVFYNRVDDKYIDLEHIGMIVKEAE